MAVFTAFNILANYKFPLNEALAFKDSMESNLTLDEVILEISEADFVISDSGFDVQKTWLKCKIKPELWKHKQYKFDETFWVVAILNNSCLYFNSFEEGWGWGRFSVSGNITKYHWEQEEMHEAFVYRFKDQVVES